MSELTMTMLEADRRIKHIYIDPPFRWGGGEMFVCVGCKREMRCDKNSVGADFGQGRVYPADRFRCPTCGAMILATNLKGIADPDYNTQEEYLRMEG